MAIDRYTWERVKNYSDDLEAWDESDGTRILFTLSDHDNMVRAEILVFTETGATYTTADTQDWPTVEHYIPREEWPQEVNEHHAGGRADQALLDAIVSYRADLLDTTQGYGSDPDGYDAWLGDTADEMTDEQKQQFAEAANQLQTLMPESDLDGERSDAMTAALQIILGEGTLAEYGQAERLAYFQYVGKTIETTGAMVAAHLLGTNLQAIAQTTGISRPTVYKRLGRKK